MKSRFTRREFLGLGASSLTLALLGAYFKTPLFHGTANANGPELAVLPSKGAGRFYIYDWAKKKVTELPNPLMNAHSAIQNRTSPNEVIVFEQYGTQCAVFDLASSKMKKLHRLTGPGTFYGHGTLHPTQELLYNTEILSPASGEGHISIRNPKTLEKLGGFPSHAHNPHDLCFLDPHTLAIANSGVRYSHTSISFVAATNGELLKKVPLPALKKEPFTHCYFTHVLALSPDEILVATEKKKYLHINDTKNSIQAKQELRMTFVFEPSPLYIINRNGETQELMPSDAEALFLRNFSVCKIRDERGLIVSAHPLSNHLMVWKGKELIHKVKLDGCIPQGIASRRNGKELLVGGPDGEMRILSTTDFKEIPGTAFRLLYGTSHILNLS